LARIGGEEDEKQIELSEIGREIEKSLIYIDEKYENVAITKYVVMPNHIHLIVLLQSKNICEEKANISMQAVIGQFKSFTTKRYNVLNNSEYEVLWQRSFYDRIIRDEKEYLDVWKYIDENPIKWELDEYHI
jgi:REP element-mobilizing transposase RayT